MSMNWTLLAIVAEGPTFGLEVKQTFDRRTGEVWPINAGQVYATLSRLEELGFVDLVDADGPEGQKTYAITDAGTAKLDEWFKTPTERTAPMRDETVLKILMAASDPSRDLNAVFAIERNAVLKRLQDLTRLKQREPSPEDVGWQCLLDSMIFQAEARIRWLEATSIRLAARPTSSAESPHIEVPSHNTKTERHVSK